ncbi:hypothetical protein J3E71DRAFT_388935 [Bipolaris maydis]|nr:hypothetical protein J3E71DRAFT_388935 [Bipolaris maydis]
MTVPDTEDSPFSCPNCHRRFQRLDARNRHTAKFCLQNNASRNKPTAIDRRARVACDGCRTQKLKCSGAHPCAACERRARPCEYSQRKPANYSDSGREDAQEITVAERSESWWSVGSTSVPDHLQTSSTASTISTDRMSSQQSVHPIAGQLETHTDLPFEHTENHGLVQEAPTNEIPELNRINQLQTQISSRLDSGINGRGDIGFDIEHEVFNFLFPFDGDMELQECTGFAPDAYQNLTLDTYHDSGIPYSILGRGPGQEIPQTLALNTDQASTRWLSLEPSLDKFDRVIVNHFINLFLQELPSMFSSWDNFRIRKTTTEEEVLAMAAVGGLYSTTSGSHVMARAMSGDARRLALTRTNLQYPEDTQQGLSLTRAVLSRCRFPDISVSDDNHLSIQMQAVAIPIKLTSMLISLCRVTDDIHILECYRAILFQWPSGLSIRSFLTCVQTNTDASQGCKTKTVDVENLQNLFMPSGQSVNLDRPRDSIHALSSVLLLAMQGTSANSKMIPSEHLLNLSSFELALHKWLRSHQSLPDAAALALFHMGFIVLHTNMTMLHRLARIFSVGESPKNTILDAAHQWKSSAGCEVALSHATDLIEVIVSHSGKIKSPSFINRNGLGEYPKTEGEAPHLAICGFSAILVKWTAELLQPIPDIEAAKGILKVGCDMLQRLHLKIASGFLRILRLLQEASPA